MYHKLQDNRPVALFLNGVYESVLEEIRNAQEKYPGRAFFLQPYAPRRIEFLERVQPRAERPVVLYLSTTTNLNKICYLAEIIGWEDKQKLSEERSLSVSSDLKTYQSNEGGLYLDINGKPAVNLITIRNLRRLTNQLAVSHLIKTSDGKPRKPRTQAGLWSTVYEIPVLAIEKSVIAEDYYTQLEEGAEESYRDDAAIRLKRLENAPRMPQKQQVLTTGYIRNRDVIAEVEHRANGICGLCRKPAPFIKKATGRPYLEIHHWVQLSEGGEDTLENAVALCPNCHKRAHFGEEREYIREHHKLPIAP
jgi:5-methylcytosine-specific restriction endonuclease McrA